MYDSFLFNPYVYQKLKKVIFTGSILKIHYRGDG